MDVLKNGTDFVCSSQVEIPDSFYNRLPLPGRLNDAFGGGLIRGQTVVVYGAPGSGKSTFCQQVENYLLDKSRVGYISGEQTVEYLAYTFKRLGIHNLPIANIVYLDEIIARMSQFDLLVIDSFPTIRLKDKGHLTKKAREALITDELVKAAQQHKCTLLIILHVTKGGTYKGGTDIIHAVDTEIELIDKSEHRCINIKKNRLGGSGMHDFKFGATGYDFFSETEAPVQKEKEKKTLKASVLTSIQQLKSPFTQHEVEKHCGINNLQSYHFLRLLVEDGKLVKIGRGKEAIFKWVK